MQEENFDLAFEKVKGLVAKFQQGEKHYLSQSYQEAEVRQDFLDDFFTALGWDVGHKIQHDPYEQEVKVERGVKVSGAQKRADYSFSIAPNFRDSKFFAEAKKPAKALKNKDDYFQSIRYGWHKAHPLSILTDFEEFHILDCRYTPDINNSLDKCYKQFHYTDYLNKEKFAEIYFLFSREAVANGSIEKVDETLPKRKGKATTKTLFPFEIHQTIDEAFLEVIDSIREKLAKAFKKQDENLTSEQLTEATQRTVDRLVFIRFLEDKLIEQEHWVSEFGEKGSVWNDFISACRKLDAKYNGIVFKEHFIDEKNFAGAEVSEFRTICQDICHLNSRFLFNEIPIHILGSIYERFLGKVVHATAKRVTVEEKPEVQKAGGVYYTPKYIVDYIVRNTVGKLIEGKTPEQIAKLRFADIACGSGSFLIGVFDCLLDHHNKYYQKNPDKAKKDKCIEKDGLWVLTIKQKQKILLNNIYGVDIDQQATEVTQLSLALKMMEDETTATANDMQVLFHEKILPDMSKNIICGNSLIGTDILTQNLFAGDEERKLNPMNYENVFKEIMQNGGFDAIVGNPPYVNNKELPEGQKKYFVGKYITAVNQFDLYTLFIENAVNLLKDDGYFSYIIPDAIIDRSSATSLRKFIHLNSKIISLLQINNVFITANVGSAVIVLQKGKNAKGKFNYLKCSEPEEFISNKIETKIISQINIPNFRNHSFLFVDDKEWAVIKKIFKDKINLESITFMGRGEELGKSSSLAKRIQGKNDIGLLFGEDIHRYKLKEPENFISKSAINKQEKLYDIKIVVRQVGDEINASFDNQKFITIQSVYTIIPTGEYNHKFILGILNSKMIDFVYKKLFKSKELFPRILLESLKELPIPAINFQNKTEKATHDKIVSLVEQMLQATKEVNSTKTDKDKTYSERKCSSLDTAINTEVYKLYDLSEEEIKIVEGEIKPV